VHCDSTVVHEYIYIAMKALVKTDISFKYVNKFLNDSLSIPTSCFV